MKNGMKKTVDIVKLLSSEIAGQDSFLIRNDDTKVNVEDLRGKLVGLYFPNLSCKSTTFHFTKVLARVYTRLAADHNKKNFEVVLVGTEEDDDNDDKCFLFTQCFSDMPWLAIPLSRTSVIRRVRRELHHYISNRWTTELVFINDQGSVFYLHNWTRVLQDYEVEAYPFTQVRVDELKEEDARDKENITLMSLLESTCLVYEHKKSPITVLEGKTVCLLFIKRNTVSFKDTGFTRKLEKIYTELQENGESFEIITVYQDEDEEEFDCRVYDSIPWPTLPFKDRATIKLNRYYYPFVLPMLVIFGPDGEELHKDGYELVQRYGIEAYPFTPEKLGKFNQIAKESFKTMTVESLLVSKGLDFVFANDGSQVPVSDLQGKLILFYFSCGWKEKCIEFTKKLAHVYSCMTERFGEKVEVIYVPFGEDVLKSFVSSMPWLNMSCYDPRLEDVRKTLQHPTFRSLVALKPNGGALTTEDGNLFISVGEDDLCSAIDKYIELLKDNDENI